MARRDQDDQGVVDARGRRHLPYVVACLTCGEDWPCPPVRAVWDVQAGQVVPWTAGDVVRLQRRVRRMEATRG